MLLPVPARSQHLLYLLEGLAASPGEFALILSLLPVRVVDYLKTALLNEVADFSSSALFGQAPAATLGQLWLIQAVGTEMREESEMFVLGLC